MKIISIEDKRYEVIFKKKIDEENKEEYVEAVRNFYRHKLNAPVVVFGHQDRITYWVREIPDAVFEDLPA